MSPDDTREVHAAVASAAQRLAGPGEPVTMLHTTAAYLVLTGKLTVDAALKAVVERQNFDPAVVTL